MAAGVLRLSFLDPPEERGGAARSSGGKNATEEMERPQKRSVKVRNIAERYSMMLLALIFVQALSAQSGFSQTISVADEPFKGDKNARVILVEFADYQCPFCARYFRETLPRIEKDYIETGKIKYVFRDFPLKSHRDAFTAAQAAYCAGEQGKYWEMHARLFSVEPVDWHDLSGYARPVGLDLQSFQRCLNSEESAAHVRKDVSDGQKAGVKATPTFFLGFTGSDGSLVQAVREIVGAQPYTAFKDALDSVLAAQR